MRIRKRESKPPKFSRNFTPCLNTQQQGLRYVFSFHNNFSELRGIGGTISAAPPVGITKTHFNYATSDNLKNLVKIPSSNTAL